MLDALSSQQLGKLNQNLHKFFSKSPNNAFNLSIETRTSPPFAISTAPVSSCFPVSSSSSSSSSLSMNPCISVCFSFPSSHLPSASFSSTLPIEPTSTCQLSDNHDIILSEVTSSSFQSDSISTTPLGSIKEDDPMTDLQTACFLLNQKIQKIKESKNHVHNQHNNCEEQKEDQSSTIRSPKIASCYSKSKSRRPEQEVIDKLSFSLFKKSARNPISTCIDSSISTSSPTSSSPIVKNTISACKSKRREKSKYQFQCTFTGCGRLFKRREHLNRHWMIHTGERPFLCNQCQRRFSRYDNLSQHIRTSHGHH